MSVRVRFADMRCVSRALTLPAPICATSALTEVAVDLARSLLGDHPEERTISLVAISASHLGDDPFPQLELPFALADDGRRPDTKKGRLRERADRALDAIRERFGQQAAGYASGALGGLRAVPDAFRELAEKDL